MEKTELLLAICAAMLLVFLLVGFMLFNVWWQRAKSNRFISERENLRLQFSEQLLRVQLEIREQSFNAVSMEIHDNVGQTLSLLKVQLNIIDQQDGLDKVLLAEARKNVSKAMTDLRDIAKSLSSETIGSETLPEALTRELQRVEHTGIHTWLLLTGTERAIAGSKQLIVFRMLQECIQNILKHAGASEIKVVFDYQPDALTIEITDNGKGFDENSVKTRSAGLGLQHLLSRAAIIEGQALIRSDINKGTTIKITTPYA